jgi:hypothetical protein
MLGLGGKRHMTAATVDTSTIPGKEDKLFHEFTALTRDLQDAAEAVREAKYPKLDHLYELSCDYERVRLKFNLHYLNTVSAQHLPTVHAYADALNAGNRVSANAKTAYIARGGKWPGAREA